MDLISANTRYLHAHTPLLSGLSTLAELSADDDPEASIRQTGRFVRAFTLYGLAHLGVYRADDYERSVNELARALAERLHIPNLYLLLRIVIDSSHLARALNSHEARAACVMSHQLAVFFQRVFGRQPDFASERYHHPDEAAASSSEHAELIRTTDAMYGHLATKLTAVTERAKSRGPNHRSAIAEVARRADIYVHVTEAMIRQALELQLAATGWTVVTSHLHSKRPVAPRDDDDRAIAAWPIAGAPAGEIADYALFCGPRCVAVVVGKRTHASPAAAIEYGRSIRGEAPMVFATDGHPYRSAHPDSGLWLWTEATGDARPVDSFYTPAGIRAALAPQPDTAQRSLTRDLRPYQQRAIAACLDALATDTGTPRRTRLVAMAPGTGKTRTAGGLIGRLLAEGRARRILYLAANGTLAEQARIALSLPRSARDLGATPADSQVRVATVKEMHARVLLTDDPAAVPPVDSYDGLIVDECPDADPRMLDHFDAVCIAFTATPTPATIERFGEPVFHYRYSDAAAAGHLIDHAPPRLISPDRLADAVRTSEPLTAAPVPAAELYRLSDTVEFPDSQRQRMLARSVTSYSFNRAACAALAPELWPHGPGKTLVFCIDGRHADTVAELLEDALRSHHGTRAQGSVLLINRTADDRQARLEQFRTRKAAAVAVTDDFLATGIDVPEIDTLVFLRPVNSRSAYAQMIGRGTRLCPAIGKRGVRIFDCVDGYETMAVPADVVPTQPPPAKKRLGPAPDHSAITHRRPIYDDEGRDARSYLVHVAEKLRDHRDDLPNLALVQQAPHTMTRAQLEDLHGALAALGITESRLQKAHSERAGEPVEVSLLGLLRHHLMHEILVENRARVARALTKMLATNQFTAIQKQAVERMAEQLQESLILEPHDLDQGAFKTQYGGFRGLDEKRFGGGLARLLDQFERALWE